MEVVPIVEIDDSTMGTLRPMLLSAVRMAQYVSIDLELSGLGDKPDISRKDIRSRYEGMRKAAEKYSIISIGIACFNGDSKHASVFQISCIPSNDLVINADTAKFLVKHGFDFNKLVQQPVTYKKNGEESLLQDLMIEIFKEGKVLIFHNGLLDLCHLYHTFVGALPEKFENFSQNWSLILDQTNTSLLDSKLICRSLFKMAHSALSFIYLMSSVRSVLCLSFPNYSSLPLPTNENSFQDPKQISSQISPNDSHSFPQPTWVTWVKIDLDSRENKTEEKLCANLLQRAFCSSKSCKKSHSVVKLVEYYKEKSESKRNRRKRRHERKNTENTDSKKIIFESDEEEENENSEPETEIREKETISSVRKIVTGSAHRAGCDAFMAGYALLSWVDSNSLPRVENPKIPGPLAKLETLKNRLNGPGPQGILFSPSKFVSKLPNTDTFDALLAKIKA